jgi:hypothetical protein
MKALRLVVIFGAVIACYFGAYFLSVTQPLLSPLGPPLTRPVYRPVDNGIVRAFFAPAHFVDAACLRSGYWDGKLLR